MYHVFKSETLGKTPNYELGHTLDLSSGDPYDRAQYPLKTGDYRCVTCLRHQIVFSTQSENHQPWLNRPVDPCRDGEQERPDGLEDVSTPAAERVRRAKSIVWAAGT
jgi:hypothetical protein